MRKLICLAALVGMLSLPGSADARFFDRRAVNVNVAAGNGFAAVNVNRGFGFRRANVNVAVGNGFVGGGFGFNRFGYGGFGFNRGFGFGFNRFGFGFPGYGFGFNRGFGYGGFGFGLSYAPPIAAYAMPAFSAVYSAPAVMAVDPNVQTFGYGAYFAPGVCP